jgi:hypothetical protein
MVVKLVDTAVTLVAMTRPWRSQELALKAKGSSIVNLQQLQEIIIIYFSANINNLILALVFIEKAGVLH